MYDSRDRTPVIYEPRDAAAPAGLPEIATAAIGFFKRQKWLLAAGVVLGLLLAIGFIFLKPRMYEARIELVFDRPNRPVVTQSPVLSDAPFDASFFESQIEVLRSEKNALAVVKRLRLDQNPEFTASGPLGSLIRFLRGGQPNPSELDEIAASHLISKLDVKRLGATMFIEAAFQSRDPGIAEQVINALAETYIADYKTGKLEVARGANEWLQQRLEELRRKAARDEQAVNAYKAKNEIVNAGGGLIADQSLTAINSELVSARAKVSDALARLQRMQTLSNSNADLSVDATVSDALNSSITTKLREEYLMLASKASEYAGRYGEGHLAVIRLRQKIKSVRESIQSELHRLTESANSEYIIAKKRQENLEKELASLVTQSQSTNRAQVTLHDLESAAQSSRSLYNLFEMRYLESAQQQSMSMNDIRLEGPASVSVATKNAGPKILAAALLGGLGAGAAAGFLREALGRVFRTTKQIEDTLNLPCVALVPRLIAQPATDAAMPDAALYGPRTISAQAGPLSTIRSERFSPFTEAIRSVKIAADLMAKYAPTDDTPAKGAIIGITSSVPGEGKSTIAVSLAQIAASVGRRAIVLDFDLRNPSLTRTFAPDASAGLIDILSGEASLENVVWREPATQMTFVPTVFSTSFDPYEVIAAPSTKRFLESLRGHYDYIIIDLSPMAAATELRATVALVDFYFFVVGWGETKIDVVQRALHDTNEVLSKTAGVVLNKVDMEEIRQYDAYDYGRYGYGQNIAPQERPRSTPNPQQSPAGEARV